ncbi:MAG: hypothetical protein R6V10_08880 [bacterium]
MKTRLLIAFWLVAALAISCAQPADRDKDKDKKKAEDEQRHVYKDLEPDVHPVPEGVAGSLPGLLNDNIYIYREVAPLLTLVSYEEDYSRVSAVRKAADAFLALLSEPAFQEDIEFWIIQVQPKEETKEEKQEGKARVVVWGVRPEEVKQYQESGDLGRFLRTSEYLLVDDEIIEKGDERLSKFPGLKEEAPSPGAPEEEPGPKEGDTAAEGR